MRYDLASQELLQVSGGMTKDSGAETATETIADTIVEVTKATTLDDVMSKLSDIEKGLMDKIDGLTNTLAAGRGATNGRRGRGRQIMRGTSALAAVYGGIKLACRVFDGANHNNTTTPAV